MQGYDPKKAAQVWQRVHPSDPPETQDTSLLPLIAAELSASATYLAMAHHYKGPESQRLRTMAQEEASHAACLKGIHFLLTGQKPRVQTAAPGPEPPEAELRRCYAGELRSIRAYEERAGQPEYGHIFAKMAREEQRHSAFLLELLGKT